MDNCYNLIDKMLNSTSDNDEIMSGNSHEFNSSQIHPGHLQQTYNLPIPQDLSRPLSFEPGFNPAHFMKTIIDNQSLILSNQLNHHVSEQYNNIEGETQQKTWASPTQKSPSNAISDLDIRRKKIENTMKLIQNMIATDNDSRKNKMKNEIQNIDVDKSTTSNKTTDGDEDNVAEVDPLEDIKGNMNDTEGGPVNSDVYHNVLGDSGDLKNDDAQKPLYVKADVEEELSMDLFLKDTAGVSKECVGDDYIISGDKTYEKAIELLKEGCPTENLYLECCFCDLLFKNVKRYLIHYKWHTSSMGQAKQLAFMKAKQEKKQTKPPVLAIKDKDGFFCHICQKSFKMISRLRSHNNKYHPQTDEAVCEMCHIVFPSAEELKNHTTEHDVTDGSGMFRCTTDGCDKMFKHKHSLTRHAYTHLEPTHVCPHCSKKFCSPALLSAHVKRHTRTPEQRKHACTFCEKSFFDKFTLTAHLRCHNNDRPFKCTNCDASYVTNSSLKRHVKISHGEKNPYSCRDCGRTFSCELMLSKHEAKMHGDPEIYPFQCKVCPYRYMTPQELRKHMYKTHKIKAKSSSP